MLTVRVQSDGEPSHWSPKRMRWLVLVPPPQRAKGPGATIPVSKSSSPMSPHGVPRTRDAPELPNEQQGGSGGGPVTQHEGHGRGIGISSRDAHSTSVASGNTNSRR